MQNYVDGVDVRGEAAEIQGELRARPSVHPGMTGLAQGLLEIHGSDEFRRSVLPRRNRKCFAARMHLLGDGQAVPAFLCTAYIEFWKSIRSDRDVPARCVGVRRVVRVIGGRLND